MIAISKTLRQVTTRNDASPESLVVAFFNTHAAVKPTVAADTICKHSTLFKCRGRGSSEPRKLTFTILRNFMSD